MTAGPFPELGFYTLPGHAEDPRDALTQPAEGERLGFGSVWISERFGTKDIGVLSGAALAQTNGLGIVAGLLAQLPVRHPIVTASYASTMAMLSGDRFAVGIGRGVGQLADATATPRLTFALMEDYVEALRKLWRGERVQMDSPVARMHGAALPVALDQPPPIIMAAMGDETCRWAGHHCESVVLTSLWTAEGVAHSTRLIREGAEAAGKDPSSVRVWTILVTACDVPEGQVLEYVVRRMNTYAYFPGIMEDTCAANGWDPAPLAGIRQALQEFDGAPAGRGVGDEATTRDLDNLRRMREVYPAEWVDEGNAIGTPEHCAEAILARFDAGADSVLLHGSPPAELCSLAAAWAERRSAGRFERLSQNPGRMA